MSPLNILLIQFEPMTWAKGRSYPYFLNFGIADGLRTNGVNVTMITTPWRSRIRDFCRGKRFDQVWFNDLSHFADIGWTLDEAVEIAPVRVGFVTESIHYSEAERASEDWLAMRDKMLPTYLSQMTHIAAVDECDVAEVQQHYGIPTMLHPVPMPTRFVSQPTSPPTFQGGFFGGSLYGERASWLQNPDLQERLGQYQSSPNARRIERVTFDWLQQRVLFLRRRSPTPLLPTVITAYLSLLRKLRMRAAQQWLIGMQRGSAVVNLPHLVKGYSSRVVEGIAAGRPVISWRIPNRPINEALFTADKEILLYDTPDELNTHIERVIADPAWASQIAANARRKLLARHTSTERARQILDWIKTGDVPIF